MIKLSVFLVGFILSVIACDVKCIENCTGSKADCLLSCGCDSDMKDLKEAFRESGAPMSYVRDSGDLGALEAPQESISGCQIECTGMCMKYAQDWALGQCLEACGCDKDTVLRAQGLGTGFLTADPSLEESKSKEVVPPSHIEEFAYDSPTTNPEPPPGCIFRCSKLCEQIPAEECLINCVTNFCNSDLSSEIPYKLILELTVLILSALIVITGVKYVNSSIRKTDNENYDYYSALA
jgi:hypothetical protein